MNYSGILAETKKDYLIERALKKILATRTFDKLKANIDGHEPPAKLAKTSGGGGVFIPDIIGIKDGQKFYYELAIKNDRIQDTVNKWKLLSQLADLRSGKFYLLVPKGNMAFVRRLLSKYSLRAHIVKM